MTEPGGEDDHAYFQAIEEVFVQLRGAPLLLSPADWQVARRWHREGVPLDLVRRALEEVFEKRKERGTKGKISSLRYCAPAVEAAWNDLRELTAPGEREEAPSFDIPARLAALAAALPAGIPGREGYQLRIRTLEGGPQAVEESLAALDLEVLEAGGAALDEAARAEVEGAVTATLASLGSRLPVAELARSRERLTRQILRQRLGLPVLSLFSPEAERAG
ncbi:MAG TPA: hypothetical protein VEL74_05515 [Thermoanaerobaculia bacterium]|nr:hypothetical protein [Thermoanaerobaculia bacterium]